MAKPVQHMGHPDGWRQLLPWQIVAALSRHGSLILQFAKRDVLLRYRGSFLGLFWSLLRPLALLAMYSVVFGQIFQPQLGRGSSASGFEFVLALFCGLVLFDFLAEAVGRAPMLVVMKPNYVKKVVFPLEIMAVSTVCAALVQMLISLALLFVAILIVRGSVPVTALYLPLIVLPLMLLALGLTWFLSSAAVFVRDINALVPVLLMLIMFASAIFYSIDRVPADLRPLFMLNPIAVLIQEARDVVLWGAPPDWQPLLIIWLVSAAVAVAGYSFFMRTKHAFADIL